MKNCEEYRSLIDLYLDNGLTRSDKQQFLSHISSCDKCREELNFAKSVKDTLAAMPQLEIPDDFTKNVRSKVEAERKKKKGIGTYLVRYGSIAAGLVLAVAIARGIDQPDFTKGSDSTLPNHIAEKAPSEAKTKSNATDVLINSAEEVPMLANEIDANAAKVQSAQDTEDKSQVQPRNVSVPDETKESSAFKQESGTIPDDSSVPPAADANEATEPSDEIANSGIAPASLTEEYVSDIPTAYDTNENIYYNSNAEAAPTDIPHSGGGVRRMTAEPVSISVAADLFGGASSIIAQYATGADGIYTASYESFNLILSKLTEAGIEFTITGEITEEAVSFVLKHE